MNLSAHIVAYAFLLWRDFFWITLAPNGVVSLFLF